VLLILQYAKNYGFYRFHKECLQMLKDAGVIVFRPSNWADTIDEVVDSVDVRLGAASRGKHWRTSTGRKQWRRRWTM
jgi:hypothetical protein